MSKRLLTPEEKAKLGALYSKIERAKFPLARAQLEYKEYEMELREAVEATLLERLNPTGEFSSQMPTGASKPEPEPEPEPKPEPKKAKK